MTAANDIWNEAPTRLSGWVRRTAKAAKATRRMENGLRSAITAISISAVMMKARWVGTVAPVSKR